MRRLQGICFQETWEIRQIWFLSSRHSMFSSQPSNTFFFIDLIWALMLNITFNCEKNSYSMDTRRFFQRFFWLENRLIDSLVIRQFPLVLCFVLSAWQWGVMNMQGKEKGSTLQYLNDTVNRSITVSYYDISGHILAIPYLSHVSITISSWRATYKYSGAPLLRTVTLWLNYG